MMGGVCSAESKKTDREKSSGVRRTRRVDSHPPKESTAIEPSSTTHSSARACSFFKRGPTVFELTQELSLNFSNLNAYSTQLFERFIRAETVIHFKHVISDISSKVRVKEFSLNQIAYLSHLQSALPVNCFSYLDEAFSVGVVPQNFVERIRDVAEQHAKELPGFARARGQFHHGLPHAIKLKEDVLRELKVRGIWQDGSREHRLFREVTCCAAILHDYVQKNEKDEHVLYESNEEATAEKVYRWLMNAFHIPRDEVCSPVQKSVRSLIQLMVYELIVGGSSPLSANLTVVRPHGEEALSMDLIDFQEAIENVLTDAGERFFDLSNTSLIDEIKQVAKVLAKNDKTPGAALLHAMAETRNRSIATSTGAEIADYTTPLLDDFFKNYFIPYFPKERMTPYYTEEDVALFGSEDAFCEAVNRQAFFINFTPHMLMPPEFLPESSEEKARLQAFMTVCRDKYLEISERDRLVVIFNTACHDYDVVSIFERVFLSAEAIEFERKFVSSQIEALRRREEELRRLGVDEAKIQLLIDANAIEKDKENLFRLKIFYEHCAVKKTAIKELVFGIVFSEGQRLAYQMNLHEPLSTPLKEAIEEDKVTWVP